MQNLNRSLNRRFEALRPSFSPRAGAGAGEGVAALRGKFDILAWADPLGPDSPMPDSVVRAMSAAIESGIGGHYEPPTGEDSLKRELAVRTSPRFGRTLDPERNIMITPGSDAGLYFALSAMLDPGDEVLVPTPSYPSNIAVPALLGARIVTVPLRADEAYRLDIDALASAITDKTRAVVLTHPNNPTSTVHDPESLRALAKVLVEHDIFLICDQAFEDHVYDGREMLSPASLPGMWERTITVCSFSKGYGLSGLRVGYLVAEQGLLEPLRTAAVLVLGAPNTLAQVGALAALRDEALLPRLHAEFEMRRTFLFECLTDVPGVRMRPSQSGILSWIDISELGTAGEVAAHLRDHAAVIVNEGDAYGPGGEGHLRIVHGALSERARFEAVARRMREALLALGNHRESRTRVAGGGRDGE